MKQDKILSLNRDDNDKERLIRNVLKTESFLVVYDDVENESTSFLTTNGLSLSLLTFFEKALSNYVTGQLNDDSR